MYRSSGTGAAQDCGTANEELTANVILLFGAGHETTVNLIGNGLLASA
jgi:cytochrome P450